MIYSTVTVQLREIYIAANGSVNSMFIAFLFDELHVDHFNNVVGRKGEE